MRPAYHLFSSEINANHISVTIGDVMGGGWLYWYNGKVMTKKHQRHRVLQYI